MYLYPTAAVSEPAGGALIGSGLAAAFAAATTAQWVSAPGAWSRHLALGALVALIPAAYAGSTTVRGTGRGEIEKAC